MPTYNISEKASAVREVQKFLFEISATADYLPPVSVDGIYGSETTEAVRLFQQHNGLSPTGATDEETWQLLYQQYITAKEEREEESELIPGNAFPIRMGDSGSHVRIVQSSLEELLEDAGPSDGFFGRKTEESIRRIEKRYGLPQTGILTRQLWNRISADYRDSVRHKIPN